MGHHYTNIMTSLKLPGDIEVTLTYSLGCDVFLQDDSAVDTAMNETDVVEQFSALVEILTQRSDTTHRISEQLRDQFILEFDDQDEDGNAVCYRPTAEEIVAGFRENFYEQEFIEREIKQYDHKRGHCVLTAKVKLSIKELVAASPDLSGWDVELEVPGRGVLTLPG